jgi:hypothetical protein
VSAEQLEAAIKEGYENGGRICGDFQLIEKHLLSVQKGKSQKTCNVCGEQVYTWCVGCGRVPVHVFPTVRVGGPPDRACFLKQHSEHYYGLARLDTAFLKGKTKRGWTNPTQKDIDDNAKHIKLLKQHA